MKQSELVAALASSTDNTRRGAEKTLEVLSIIIGNTLTRGEDVALPIGKFKVSTRPARKARNPQTGEEVQVPEKRVVKFVASKTLKELL
ncbi:MAG: HU family DNA-binding protein [Betaproteobacteria bacterium]|nr:HU family DNA-binding protein [Betaproteobacteria bacterium]